MKANNIVEIMAQPDVDGALVGGASLNADEFAKIVLFYSRPADAALVETQPAPGVRVEQGCVHAGHAGASPAGDADPSAGVRLFCSL